MMKIQKVFTKEVLRWAECETYSVRQQKHAL